MSDLIERDKAIDALDDFQSDIENCVTNAYAIARQRMITIPSAEPTWASVLAELHEQFFALEKEIRKASAEMSAIIREYVDRPKGEWILECDAEGEDDNLYRCSECGCNYGCQEYDIPNFCPNCGARMKGADDE